MTGKRSVIILPAGAGDFAVTATCLSERSLPRLGLPPLLA